MYSHTSTNSHLSTLTIFFAESLCIHFCFRLSTMATSLQWPLFSVPKVAIVERFNCINKVKDRFSLTDNFSLRGESSPLLQVKKPTVLLASH